LSQDLLQFGMLFEDDTKSDLRFARNQFVSHVSEQCVEHLWEAIKEDCLERETSSLLFENACVDLGVLVFSDVENSFDTEMMEHA
jgi:hypothetical protein